MQTKCGGAFLFTCAMVSLVPLFLFSFLSWWRCVAPPFLFVCPNFIVSFYKQKLYFTPQNSLDQEKHVKIEQLIFFPKKKTKTKKRLEKKTGRQLSHMVTDELDCISNTPTCQKALKCRHCGGCITEGYVLNVHPDVKFHPNCLKCW